MLVPDTIQLERLAWAVFDNIMGPGEAPPLCGFETYDQIIRRLASKAYKGVHMHCPACTSASFGTEVKTVDSGKSRVQEKHKTPALHNDTGCERRVQGIVLCL